MTEIGVRALRDHLSRCLDRVKAGDEIVVTDRGRAIARITPIGGERTIDRLVAAGLVTPATRPTRATPTPVKTKGSVSDLIVEQRR